MIWFHSNSIVVCFLFPPACQYGQRGCDYGAICTEENECQCSMNCTDEQCRIEQTKCQLFYSKNKSKDSISLEELICSTMNCSHGAKCIVNNYHLPSCSCPANCAEYTQIEMANGPICGSDRLTYETICDLKKKSCERQENLSISHWGKCRM